MQEAAKLAELFNRPRFKSRSLRPLTGAVTSPGSSRFPKDSGVEVAYWGCCSNWFTPSQTGDQPTDPNFLVFQENSVSTFTLQRQVFYFSLWQRFTSYYVIKGTGHFWMCAFHYSYMQFQDKLFSVSIPFWLIWTVKWSMSVVWNERGIPYVSIVLQR